MKATCSSCQAQYTIADEKVPPQGARVRCRRCQGVFTIAPPALQPAPLPTIPPAGQPLSPPPPPRPPRPAATPSPARTPSASFASPKSGDGGGIPGSGMSPIPEGLPPEERAKHERARRLARVLASDIAIYNQEKRERGLRDGNLVAVLGYEIKKSWETYKERVSPELANATPYFRDALNEMLAGGRKIF